MTEQPKQPKQAGRRLEWPTLWHKDQLPFPWGSPKRVRKPRQPTPASSSKENRRQRRRLADR